MSIKYFLVSLIALFLLTLSPGFAQPAATESAAAQTRAETSITQKMTPDIKAEESPHAHNFLTLVFILAILIGLCAAAEWYFGISEVLYGEYLRFKEWLKSKK